MTDIKGKDGRRRIVKLTEMVGNGRCSVCNAPLRDMQPMVECQTFIDGMMTACSYVCVPCDEAIAEVVT